MSRSEESAWHEFVAAHSGGGVLDGRVRKVLPFGAFVEVGDGMVGLLPRAGRSDPPEAGTTVSVRIGSIDVENRRFSLVRA